MKCNALSPALKAADIGDLQAVVAADSTDQDGSLRKPCFWTCQSIYYLERSAKHSQMQFALLDIIWNFYLSFLLAHRARSTLLQLTRCINYLLNYRLTNADSSDNISRNASNGTTPAATTRQSWSHRTWRNRSVRCVSGHDGIKRWPDTAAAAGTRTTAVCWEIIERCSLSVVSWSCQFISWFSAGASVVAGSSHQHRSAQHHGDIDMLVAWCSGDGLCLIKEVALHRAELVLGRVTACGQINHLVM